VGDITIGKNHLVHLIFRKQSREILFRVDGDPTRVIGSGKFWRVNSIGNERDLSGGEGNDLIGWMIPEEGIEIVEIPSSSPKDDHPNGFTL
jgi:hypothetical protein